MEVKSESQKEPITGKERDCLVARRKVPKEGMSLVSLGSRKEVSRTEPRERGHIRHSRARCLGFLPREIGSRWGA